MKPIMSSLLSCLLIIGCAQKERYVRLVADLRPKTTMIAVDTMVDVVSINFTPKGITLKKENVPVKISGSGVFISPYGHILTCRHLFTVGVSSTVTVRYLNETREATVLSISKKADLALLKIDVEGPVPFARLADPRKLRVGQEVMIVGNPFRLDWSVSHGIISALNRDLERGYNLVQVDAPVNPGNSGGPVFNLAGELLGIVSLGTPGSDGLGFAVEVGQLIEFLTKFRGIDKSLPKYNLGYWQGFWEALGVE